MSKTSVGVDISDHTIEIIEIKERGGRVKILNLASMALPAGVVENGRIKDKEKLAELVKEIFAKAKPGAINSKKIVFGLPEAQVFLHSFYLGAHDKRDREELILQEVKLNIPIKEDDLSFSYKIISDGSGNNKILAAIAAKSVIKEWLDFFSGIKTEVEILDIEALAVFRGLFPVKIKKTVCILDIGSKTSHISIFDEFGLHYSFSSYVAGNSITNAVVGALKVKTKEAESIKTQEGLMTSNTKVVTAIEGELNKLISTVKESFNYFKSERGREVEEIVLVGGSSRLNGLLEYLKKNLTQALSIGSVKIYDKRIPIIYIEAYGLALRGLNKKWDKTDPSFLLGKKKKKQSIKKAGNIKKGIGVNKIFSLFKFKKIDKKVRFQIILLIAILIVGAIVMAVVFSFRN